MKALIDNFYAMLFLCLTLGLAPFFPEPHILGKIRWVSGGAVGMSFMDWFDLFFHGIPWLLFFRIVFLRTKSFFSKY